MTDKLLAFVLQLAVGLLDKWLDDRIAKSGMLPTNKARIMLLENELVAFLEGPIGIAMAKAIGRAIIDQRFANDPTTGSWG